MVFTRASFDRTQGLQQTPSFVESSISILELALGACSTNDVRKGGVTQTTVTYRAKTLRGLLGFSPLEIKVAVLP